MTMKFPTWIFRNLQTPPTMAKHTLWRAFPNNLQVSFSVQYTVNIDTVNDVKQNIWAMSQPYLAHIPHWMLDLY